MISVSDEIAAELENALINAEDNDYRVLSWGWKISGSPDETNAQVILTIKVEKNKS